MRTRSPKSMTSSGLSFEVVPHFEQSFEHPRVTLVAVVNPGHVGGQVAADQALRRLKLDLGVEQLQDDVEISSVESGGGSASVPNRQRPTQSGAWRQSQVRGPNGTDKRWKPQQYPLLQCPATCLSRTGSRRSHAPNDLDSLAPHRPRSIPRPAEGPNAAPHVLRGLVAPALQAGSAAGGLVPVGDRRGVDPDRPAATGLTRQLERKTVRCSPSRENSVGVLLDSDQKRIITVRRGEVDGRRHGANLLRGSDAGRQTAPPSGMQRSQEAHR